MPRHGVIGGKAVLKPNATQRHSRGWRQAHSVSREYAAAPWPFTTMSGRVYARSSSDDKSPIIALLAGLGCGFAPRKNIPLTVNLESDPGRRGRKRGLAKSGTHAAIAQKMCWMRILLITGDGPVHQSGAAAGIFWQPRVSWDSTLRRMGANSRACTAGHYGNWAPNPALWNCLGCWRE